MSTRLSILGLLLALLASSASAQVTVTDAWVRGTVPGQTGTGAFMQLTSAVDMTLIGVASPAAKVVEIHEMAQEGRDEDAGHRQARAAGREDHRPSNRAGIT